MCRLQCWGCSCCRHPVQLPASYHNILPRQAPDASDSLPLIDLNVASVTASVAVTEGGKATFTVTTDPIPAADLVVRLPVSEAAGSDFVAAGDEGWKTVTIAAGSAKAPLTVATVDDSADEPDGSMTAALAADTGYTVAAAPSTATTVAVSDNDIPAGLTISIHDAEGNRGNCRSLAGPSLDQAKPRYYRSSCHSDAREIRACPTPTTSERPKRGCRI